MVRYPRNNETNPTEIYSEEEFRAIDDQETIESKIKKKIKDELTSVPDEIIERIAKSLLTDLTVAESRKTYAVSILHRTRKYVQGYLKNYRVEVEVVDNRYPLELHVKVYY